LTPQAGPRLIGWPGQLSWSDFTNLQTRPEGESEDASIAMQMRPGELHFLQEGGQHRFGDVEFNMIQRNRPIMVATVPGSRSGLVSLNDPHL
jgi:hypothetical protein